MRDGFMKCFSKQDVAQMFVPTVRVCVCLEGSKGVFCVRPIVFAVVKCYKEM